jgi:hypothetical protein
MKMCLFWVKEKVYPHRIIPVFDVMHLANFKEINFLVYDYDDFKYKNSCLYKPIATDWQKCCEADGE